MMSFLRRLSLKCSLERLSGLNFKLISVWVSTFLFLVILTILILNNSINKSISQLLPDTLQQFQDDLGYQVSVSKIEFSLLGGISIHDLVLSDADKDVLGIERLKFSISLISVLRKTINISKISASGIYLPSKTLEQRDEIFKKIVGFFRSSSQPEFFKNFTIKIKTPKIYLKNLKLALGQREEDRFILFHIKFYSKAKRLICQGSANLSTLRINLDMLDRIPANIINEDVRFYIDVVPYEDNLLLNTSKILARDIKMVGSGIIYNFKKEPYLDIKFISNPLNFNEAVKSKSDYYLSGLLNLTSKLYGRVKSPKFETEITLLDSYIYFSRNIFRIGDVSCNIGIGKEGIDIRGFTAVVDNRFPFFLNGTIRNLLDPEFDIEITSVLRKPVMQNIAENADLYISLDIKKTKGSLDSSADLSFVKQKRGGKRYFSRKIISKFSDISFDAQSLNSPDKRSDSSLLRIMARDIQILDKSLSGDELVTKETFEFNDFKLDTVFDPGFLTVREFSCQGYEGSVNAYGNIDFTQKPYIYNISLVLNNIEINKLRRFYPIDCNLLGKMSGRFLFQNEDPSFVKGIIEIKDGHLDGLEPLNQTADFLGISNIKQLEHANVYTVFSSDRQGFYIDRFDLDAEGVIIRSSFDINKKDWINGNISLSLSRDFLEESDRFRLLLHLTRERSQMVDFDFQIAGSSGGLRIQLLEGQFRDRLIKRLSRGIQDKIETEINKVLDSIQTQD